MDDDLGVGRGLEDRAKPDEGVAQLSGIHDVPVVRHGKLTVHAIHENRLRVGETALARRRVADVTDGHATRKLRERHRVERLAHVPHRPGHAHELPIGGSDASALLTSMLERVEAEVSEVARLGVPEDSENATFVAEFVEHQRSLIAVNSVRRQAMATALLEP